MNKMEKLNQCNYLDLNSQNASDMNLNCTKNPSLGYDKYCMSQYKLYDPIAMNSENISIIRGVDAGYGIQNQNNVSSEKIKNINQSSGIEGFTGKMFYTDNGPGKSNVLPNECPQGYKWCNKTNACVQVCTNCKYKDNMKSQEFNEYDSCFPNGVYDGINKDGSTKCTCGKDNKYCSDKFLFDFFLERSTDLAPNLLELAFI